MNEPKKVIIPYIRGIKLDYIEDRRTINKFIKLLVSVTYFNRHQRVYIDNYILSEMKDFEIANKIWESIHKYESSKLPEYETNIINEISKYKEGINITHLSKILNKDTGNLQRKINKMEENGLIYTEKRTINEYIGEGKRQTKPSRFCYSTKTPPKCFRFCTRFCTMENLINLAVQDLYSLNIKELKIPKNRFCTFSKVRERETMKKLLKELFAVSQIKNVQ